MDNIKQKNFFNKRSYNLFITAGLGLVFALAFFIPRYLAHLQYDPLEDEILAIGNNLEYSMPRLLLAPDFTHPGLWYFLMDPLTACLGLSHGIFYYRLVQMVILFVLLLWSIYSFYQVFPKKFFIIFLCLLLSNIYLIHLTSQHRMYSMVLGIGIFYSFYWLAIIQDKKRKLLFHELRFLAIIAVLGFFTNYSMIWLIPIWPIAYFLRNKTKIALKNIINFSVIFFLLISWFIPIFIVNVRDSVAANQWSLDLNFFNATTVFGNYFGIISFEEDLLRFNPLLFLFVILMLLSILFYSIYRKKTDVLLILSITLISFAVFLIAVYLTDKSLLYARTSITIVIAFYVLLAFMLSKLPNKFAVTLCSLLCLLQLSQFVIYFFPENPVADGYQDFNYRYNPIRYFVTFNFEKEACLVPSPPWNTNAHRFFLGKKLKIIPVDQLEPELVMSYIKKCPEVYLLEQTSINREFLDHYYNEIFNVNFELREIDSYENQTLNLVAF